MSTELAIINLQRQIEKQNYILSAILDEMRKGNKIEKIEKKINEWQDNIIEDESNFDYAPELIQEINTIIKEDN